MASPISGPRFAHLAKLADQRKLADQKKHLREHQSLREQRLLLDESLRNQIPASALLLMGSHRNDTLRLTSASCGSDDDGASCGSLSSLICGSTRSNLTLDSVVSSVPPSPTAASLGAALDADTTFAPAPPPFSKASEHHKKSKPAKKGSKGGHPRPKRSADHGPDTLGGAAPAKGRPMSDFCDEDGQFSTAGLRSGFDDDLDDIGVGGALCKGRKKRSSGSHQPQPKGSSVKSLLGDDDPGLMKGRFSPSRRCDDAPHGGLRVRICPRRGCSQTMKIPSAPPSDQHRGPPQKAKLAGAGVRQVKSKGKHAAPRCLGLPFSPDGRLFFG